jgi:hypothetical protein
MARGTTVGKTMNEVILGIVEYGPGRRGPNYVSTREVCQVVDLSLNNGNNAASFTATATQRDLLAAELERGSSPSMVYHHSSPIGAITDPQLATENIFML